MEEENKNQQISKPICRWESKWSNANKQLRNLIPTLTQKHLFPNKASRRTNWPRKMSAGSHSSCTRQGNGGGQNRQDREAQAWACFLPVSTQTRSSFLLSSQLPAFLACRTCICHSQAGPADELLHQTQASNISLCLPPSLRTNSSRKVLPRFSEPKVPRWSWNWW